METETLNDDGSITVTAPSPDESAPIPHKSGTAEYQREYRRRRKAQAAVQVNTESATHGRGRRRAETPIPETGKVDKPKPRKQAEKIVSNLAAMHRIGATWTGIGEFALTGAEKAELVAVYAELLEIHPLPAPAERALVWGPAIEVTAEIEYRKLQLFQGAMNARRAEQRQTARPQFRRRGGQPQAAQTGPPPGMESVIDPDTGLTVFRPMEGGTA